MLPHWSRAIFKGAVTGALCLAALGSAAGQDPAGKNYPAKPVRIVVPYAAGGGTDALARYLAQGLERRLGQPFIIENRPGQGTATGGAYVARSAPDGYTLLAATSSTLAFNPSVYKKLPYDPLVDFSPISLVAAVPFVLVVNPSLPVGSVSDLIKLAKARPGELSYASGGMGAPHHIYMELFKSMTGTDIRHIPYRGGPALGDVVAGHVPIMFGDVGPVTGLVREGRVKALGVTVGKRVETLPDVPTLLEAGLPGYEANSWQSLVAPANVPLPIVAALNTALTTFLAEPATRSHFLQLGMQPLSSTPQEFASYLRAEIAKWAPIINAAGATED
ncbi:MAG TPA: tripartite tricarboxylate transporter substrate binding protein [Xanthobacteraceae bacterium]|nr:tripartite tricarboxylate transporter substrate binding protein [Xanthobacteraceae bacterium]